MFGLQIPNAFGQNCCVCNWHDDVASCRNTSTSRAEGCMSSPSNPAPLIDPQRARRAAAQLRRARLRALLTAMIEFDQHSWGAVQLWRHGAFGELGLRFEIVIQPEGEDSFSFPVDRDIVLTAIQAKESPFECALGANIPALSCIARYDTATATLFEASAIAPPVADDPIPLPTSRPNRLFANK
jgi:hypothetical protein